MKTTLFATFLLLTRVAVVLGNPISRIASADDFIEFSNNVNAGTNYSGTTVFLDDDIDMNGIPFEPIGNFSKYEYSFQGTFEGQGHTFSNLVISSSSKYAGLFGFTEGFDIKNVVIDDSCSITSSYNSSYNDAFVGGFLGQFISDYGSCSIENSVNMASVTFIGNVSGYYKYLYIGGFVGELIRCFSDYVDTAIKNSVNYGSVTQSGHSEYAYIGGVVGHTSSIFTGYKVYIQNCFNYGAIAYNGTAASNLNVGGIVGYSGSTVVENCVSYGNITSSEKSKYIGSIVGHIDYECILTYCYWNESINCNAYGYKSSSSTISNTTKFNRNFELNKTVSIGKYSGTSLIEALNAYSDHYSLLGYSRWLLNKNERSLSFTVNKVKLSFTMKSKLILLPSFANDKRFLFDGWYVDSACTMLLTGFEISTSTDLYGKWAEDNNYYTITFNTQGGTPIDSISAQCLTVVKLPGNSTRNNCIFYYWRNEYRDKVKSPFTMPARNITLTAMWKCTHIVNADDLVILADFINSGVIYSGTTVFLDDDLNMSGIPFEPIGIDYMYSFQGTFEGQGHVISSLAINSSSQYAGLFGYSQGSTIKNVVVDRSCSITSSYSKSGNDAFLGGITGYCPASYTPCVVENNVNMASVTFTGVISSNLYLGGIIGRLRYFDISMDITTIKNCANYGSVTHSGTSEDSYIGGVVGHSLGHASKYTLYVQNCFNYGIIAHNGKTTRDLSIGGIVGYSEYTDVENCVSSGIIMLSSITTSANNYIKSIVGNTNSDTNITHCFWTSDVGYDQYDPENSNVDNEVSQVTIDSKLMNRLNDYSKTKSWGTWAMLNLKGGNINNITQKYLTVNNKYFPDPEKKRYIFKGWYKDFKLGEKYNPKEVTDVVNVYATYEKNKGSFSVKVTPLLSLIISLFFF